MARKLTTEEFIRRANLVHKGKYSYENVKYIASNKEVYITCPIHGDFLQKPVYHLQGRGCNECKKTSISKEHKGKAKLSIRKVLFGVARVDVDYAVCKTNAYVAWCDMLRRCYSEKYHKKKPTYKGCSVCDEWLLFSNFKRWFDENYIDGYVLDKDILLKNNKVYSPDTCCFVPKCINSLLTNRKMHRGLEPIGVSKTYNGVFVANISINGKKRTIARCNNQEEAFITYKQAREKHIQEVAVEYYSQGKITERVYNALINYRVEITD